MTLSIPRYLYIQFFAYISVGVFLIISHNLYEYLILRYFGYILLSISIILILNIPLFELSRVSRINRKLRLFFRLFTRRTAIELDRLFLGILPMLTIAALFLTILNENEYINSLKDQNNISISTVEQYNLEVVLIIVGFGLLLFIFSQIFPFFITRWRIGLLLLGAIVVFIILNYFNTPPLLSGLYLLLISLFPILFSLRRNTRRRVWRSFDQAGARFFFLISISIFFAGIPASFSGIFSLNDFWGKSLCFLCVSSAFSLKLSISSILFPLLARVIFKSGFLLLLAGILYIWVIAFNSEIYWVLVTWIICVIVSLSSEIFINRRASLAR